MADEVADSMDRMKLTSEEEEVITISDEGRVEALESCQLSLIGKFLTCKSFNKMAVKNTIRRAWGLDKSLQILEVGPNLFQFKFQSEFEMDRVLRGGLWSFDNQLLMLQRWKKGMTVGNIRMDKASIWVQIWGFPFDMISPWVAKEVGNRLRDIEEVEERKGKDDVNFFLRVRVALPITKLIRRGGFIAGSDGECHWVQFKYERLPLFCHFCGMLGHDLKHCVVHYAAEKQGGSVEYPYGEFLKAAGGRGKVVQPQKFNPKSNLEEGKDMVTESSVVVEAGQTVVVMEESPETSKAVAEDEAVNPGEIFSNMEANVMGKECAEVAEIMETDKEDNYSANIFGKAIISADVAKENCITEAAHMHVPLNMFNSHSGLEVPGLTFVKSKSTWTRINRMDFGLGSLAKAFVTSRLGKRELSDKGCEQDEQQRNKRNKQDEVEGSLDDISVGVDGHPCREQ